jgi:predicted RNA-binding Zn-ribbon protein involved in translation (DUF1610 family)
MGFRAFIFNGLIPRVHWSKKMAYKAFKAVDCPFCGNDTIIVMDSEECQGDVVAVCEYCGARGPETNQRKGLTLEGSAVEAWNYRKLSLEG